MRDDRLRRVKVRKKTDVLQGHGPQRLRAVQENIADLVSKVGALEVLPVLLGHAISERLRRNKGHLLDLLESRCVGLDVLAALRQRIFIIADEDCERLLGHGITASGLKGSQPFGKMNESLLWMLNCWLSRLLITADRKVFKYCTFKGQTRM